MEDLIMMSKEERHLTTLIRTYEDRIIRSKMFTRSILLDKN